MVRVHRDGGVANHTGPRAVRACPRGHGRSVGRGTCRPAIEPRKSGCPGCRRRHGGGRRHDGGVFASLPSARRGHRPWHAHKLLAREPGNLTSGHRPFRAVWSASGSGEPKPVMHGREKSDPAIVAVKPPNDAGSPVEEGVEPRAGTEGNAAEDQTRAGRRTGKACHGGSTAYDRPQGRTGRNGSPRFSTTSTSICSGRPSSR